MTNDRYHTLKPGCITTGLKLDVISELGENAHKYLGESNVRSKNPISSSVKLKLNPKKESSCIVLKVVTMSVSSTITLQVEDRS